MPQVLAFELCHMLQPDAAGAILFGSALVVGFTRAAKNVPDIPRNLTEIGEMELNGVQC